MELKYKNWNNVSITNWRRIKDVLLDEGLEEVTRNVALLSILCDVDESVIWNLNVNQLKPLMSQIGWIGEFDFPKNIRYKQIRIGNTLCTIETDLQKMTIAQYTDFQTLYKDFDNNIGAILACFIIPKGHKYGEDYDTMEFAKLIEDNLSIVESNSICFFFVKNWANSIKATQLCLEWEIKRMRKKKWMNQEKLKELEKRLEALTSLYGSV